MFLSIICFVITICCTVRFECQTNISESESEYVVVPCTDYVMRNAPDGIRRLDAATRSCLKLMFEILANDVT